MIVGLVAIFNNPVTAFAEHAVGWAKLQNLTDEVICSTNIYHGINFKLPTTNLRNDGSVTEIFEENGYQVKVILSKYNAEYRLDVQLRKELEDGSAFTVGASHVEISYWKLTEYLDKSGNYEYPLFTSTLSLEGLNDTVSSIKFVNSNVLTWNVDAYCVLNFTKHTAPTETNTAK